MASFVKFSGPDLDSSREFSYPNIWERQDFGDWSRLAIGASEKEVALILNLLRDAPGPYGVLYVLLVSRCGRTNARYQNPIPLSFDELEEFLYTFQEFIEQDGRHHLWVMSHSTSEQLVFDQHNIIYAYGDLNRYERQLNASGFRSGEVQIPAPHAHNYHQEFDAQEDELMNYWGWLKSPLQSTDTYD